MAQHHSTKRRCRYRTYWMGSEMNMNATTITKPQFGTNMKFNYRGSEYEIETDDGHVCSYLHPRHSVIEYTITGKRGTCGTISFHQHERFGICVIVEGIKKLEQSNYIDLRNSIGSELIASLTGWEMQ